MHDTPDITPLAESSGARGAGHAPSERVELGDGKWFDARKATSWSEAKGNEHTTRQTLYRTRKMAWILKRWSGRSGGKATYERVKADYAVHWLLYNGHRIPKPEFGDLDEL